MVTCKQTRVRANAAFIAQFCGESAVVCVVYEDCPEPATKPEFGEFATWTQANAVAGELNDALGLKRLEARRIAISAILARTVTLSPSS